MFTFIKNREFRWITISDWISVFGDSIFYLAMISYAATFEKNSIAITLITISETLPDILSCITGYLGDRTKNKIRADLLSSLIRAIIYMIIAVLFIIIHGWSLLLIIALLNIISDLFGVYSDNLRFPEIYAIVPEEEYESSAGFSAAGYYLFDAIAKMSGGIVLIILNYRYELFSLLNALTFLLAGLCLFKVKKSVEIKINKLEKDEINENNKSNFIKNFILACKELINNKPVFKIIVCIIIWNGLLFSLLPVTYVLIANNNSLLIKNFALTISIINFVSLCGLILGNCIGSIVFSNTKLYKLLSYGTITLFVTTTIIVSFQIELMLFCFLILNFIEGALSIKFNKFLFSNQKYKNLGISVGITNTALTITTPIFLSIIMALGNITTTIVSFYLIILMSLIYFIVIIRKKEGLLGDKN